MSKILLAGALLFAPFVLAGEQTQETTTDGPVRQVYDGSSDLPDAIAFGEFLKLVNGTHKDPDPDSREAYLHIVSEAIGKHPHKDMGSIQSRGAYFRSQYRQMRLEQIEGSIQLLCAPDIEVPRKAPQVHQALNASDDLGNSIKEKYLILTLNALSAEEQEAFTAFLDELKGGISYATVDSESVHDDSEVGTVAAKACRHFQTEYNKLLSEMN